MVARAPASRRSPEQTDERLLVAAAQKDPARFGELYEIHFGGVYGFIARRVGDRDVAEDLTSEVFHKALANLQRFEWRGAPFGAWLLRIAANAIVDRGKKSGRELSWEDPPDVGWEVDLAEAMDFGRLLRMVEELPEDQRQVVTMRFAEQRSIKEIAGQLGRSEGAVKQLQFRGLQKLRVQMDAGKNRKPQRTQRNTKESGKSGKKSGGGNG
jgi:RNA polymerase sigma-70 factor (ECF subfamily)